MKDNIFFVLKGIVIFVIALGIDLACHHTVKAMIPPDKSYESGQYVVEEYYINQVTNSDNEMEKEIEYEINLEYAGTIDIRPEYNIDTCCFEAGGKTQTSYAIGVRNVAPMTNTLTLKLDDYNLGGTGTAVIGEYISAPKKCSSCKGIYHTEIIVGGMYVYRHKPQVLTQPGEVTVSPNGTCAVYVDAKYTKGYQWQVSYGDDFYDINDGLGPNGIIYNGTNTPQLYISNIPSGADKAKFRCVLIGTSASKTISKEAQLSVNTPADITPEPAATQVPTPIVSGDVTPVPQPSVDPTPTVFVTPAPTKTPEAPSPAEEDDNIVKPSQVPDPTTVPTAVPTAAPTQNPTPKPTQKPTPKPTPYDEEPVVPQDPIKPALPIIVIPTQIPFFPSTSSSAYNPGPSPTTVPIDTSSSSKTTSSSSSKTPDSESDKKIFDDKRIEDIKTFSSSEAKSDEDDNKKTGPESAPGGRSDISSSFYIRSSTMKTIMKDGILYIVDDDTQAGLSSPDEVIEEEEKFELDKSYSAGDLMSQQAMELSSNKKDKWVYYVAIAAAFVIGLILLLFFLFFGVIVEGECEEHDEVFDLCAIRLLYRNDSKWCVKVGECFDENAVLRLRLGILFAIIFKDWQLTCIASGVNEGVVRAGIEQGMLLYRKKIDSSRE